MRRDFPSKWHKIPVLQHSLVGQTLYDVLFALSPIHLVGLGFACGWLAHKWWSGVKCNKSSAREEKAREEEETKAREHSLILRIKDLDVAIKAAFYVMYENDYMIFPDNVFRNDIDRILIYCETEKVLDGTKFTLSESTRELFDSYPELLENGKAFVERERNRPV